MTVPPLLAPSPTPDQLGARTYFRGRVALRSILRALGVGSRDHVATQAFTCVAVPEAILAAGARPLFIDTEEDGVNMSADHLRARLTSDTRAIVVQHTFGIPARMDLILEVADAAGLPVIEDCCHSIGSTYRGAGVGTFGRAAFYSYEWGKPAVAGVGGSAVTADPGLSARLDEQAPEQTNPPRAVDARLRAQYVAYRVIYRPSLYWPVRWLFRFASHLGVAQGNYNLEGLGDSPEFGWAMSPSTRRRLDSALRREAAERSGRIAVARVYRDRIDSERVRHISAPIGAEVVHARYPLIVSGKKGLLDAARRSRVEIADWYGSPVHPLQGHSLSAAGYEPGSCPAAERLSETVVSLSTHAKVGRRQIETAITLLNEGRW